MNWSILENLSTGLAFTYANHEYDNNPALSATLVKGNDIDTAPETLGSATLRYQPIVDADLELEWVHIGEYYEDPQNQHKYEGHDLLHIRARWQMTESSAIFCRIMNLTDEDYAERADFGFGNDRYFVGTPRSFYLGVDMSF